MMNLRVAMYAVALVIAGAIAATLFRVSTASERVSERRKTAQSVCASSGGAWVKVDNDEICQGAARRREP